jgi:hypothetical protein
MAASVTTEKRSVSLGLVTSPRKHGWPRTRAAYDTIEDAHNAKLKPLPPFYAEDS